MPRIPLVLLALTLLNTSCGCEAPKGPHVLFISLDSTRRDMLSLYGYESVRAPGTSNTPRLEALAAGGVVLEDAYSSSAWTLPAHVSMMLGQSELVHAVDLDHQRPSSKLTPLPEILHDAGYHTAGFFSGPYLDPLYGFGRGFDRYEACYSQEVIEANERLQNARNRLEIALTDGDEAAIEQATRAEKRVDGETRQVARTAICGAEVTDAVLAQLEEAVCGDSPIFVFAHYFDPHYDYVAPAPYDTLFDPEYAGTEPLDNFLDNPAISVRDKNWQRRRVRVASDRQLEHIRTQYAGEIAWTDAQLGRIFDKLEELGIADDTLVVVTSDHGDEFFEHGGLGHRSTLFEELVQVPMVLRFPGKLPAGERREGLVSTIDIMPTVLELLDIDAPPGLVSSSFADLLKGEDKGSDRAVFSRLVRNTFGRVKVPGQTKVDVRVMRLTLLESYRQGSIKITRERSWATLQEELSPELTLAFQKQSDMVRDREILHWIDVESFSLEESEHHSESFEDPRAALALRNFQGYYRTLLDRRKPSDLVEASAASDQTSALEALGYTGAGQGASTGDGEFVFPPPGE
ncbi:MAG: arylsulfatase A-like enzyme [Planctomycetota bacterium]|jgi:arylsulfatase A-like enzyme